MAIMLAIKGQWTLTSPWSAFSAGSIKYKGTADSNSATVDIKFAEYGGGDWQTQLRVLGSTNVVGSLEAGKDYKVKVDYTASKAFDGLVKIGEKVENVKFAEGTNSLEISYKAETERPDIYLNLGYAPADEELNIKLTLVKVEDIQPTVDPTSNNVTSADVTQPDATSADVTQPDATSADVTSPDATSADATSADVTSPDATSADVTSPDATSADVTTTPKATTAKPTTAKPTTAKPTTAKPTTKKASLKKTKITKKITKKLSSKKVKLTFKKVKGAKKYTVQVSTSKKFKKVLYKKTVKKTKITLSSKKLKGKKKLYVRVKAVGAKKWSKVVKIKVKK